MEKNLLFMYMQNLVHLPEDVLEFGCVDNFSAFPFKNFLQKLKHMLKHCGKPLEQVVRRYHEFKTISAFSNNKTNEKKQYLQHNTYNKSSRKRTTFAIISFSENTNKTIS